VREGTGARQKGTASRYGGAVGALLAELWARFFDIVSKKLGFS
jgi:hypothetical protein